jgi:hypothetical protein
MKAVTVCVEFDDLLRVTLPRYLRLFDEVLVVTREEDARTQELVAWERTRGENVRAFVTNAFELGGSPFNKGAALEAAMDEVGRKGWICTFDADMMLPEGVSLPELRPGCLYGARRRQLPKGVAWRDYEYSASWVDLPLLATHHPWKGGFCTLGGHFLLFHANDAALADRPWFTRDQKYAGGYDSDFVACWRPEAQGLLPLEMLHLGTPETNWAGRVDDRLDEAPIPCREARQRQMEQLFALRRERGNYSGERL